MGFKVKKTPKFDDIEVSLRKAAKVDPKLLKRCGEESVIALRDATPANTYKTANAWKYEVTQEKGAPLLVVYNEEMENGVNVATVLDEGHVSAKGNWVQGEHFIEPTITPIFDKLEKEVFKEGLK